MNNERKKYPYHPVALRSPSSPGVHGFQAVGFPQRLRHCYFLDFKKVDRAEQMAEMKRLKWELMIQKELVGGFKHFLFSPLFGEDEPILTSIFFRWVGSTTNQRSYTKKHHEESPKASPIGNDFGFSIPRSTKMVSSKKMPTWLVVYLGGLKKKGAHIFHTLGGLIQVTYFSKFHSSNWLLKVAQRDIS